MPTFVRIVSFYSRTGDINEKKDTNRINEVMKNLQEKGAKILDVKVSTSLPTAFCIITYESYSPLDV